MNGTGWLFIFAFTLAMIANFLPSLIVDRMTYIARRTDAIRQQELGFDIIEKSSDNINWEFLESYHEKRKYVICASVVILLIIGIFATHPSQFYSKPFWFFLLFLNFEMSIIYVVFRNVLFAIREDEKGNLRIGRDMTPRSLALAGCSGCIVAPASLAISFAATLAVIWAFEWLHANLV